MTESTHAADDATAPSVETVRSHHMATLEEIRKRLRPPHFQPPSPVRNANEVAQSQLSPLDKFALAITDKVGSMGFFLIIFTWTVCWTGFNILATEVRALHLRPFDPFPAFVAYLLISNVIQILLMPLIMVGQNVQNRHAEARAELDFQVNRKAELEVALLFTHIERTTELVVRLMQHMGCSLTAEELKAIESDNDQARQILLGRETADVNAVGNGKTAGGEV